MQIQVRSNTKHPLVRNFVGVQQQLNELRKRESKAREHLQQKVEAALSQTRLALRDRYPLAAQGMKWEITEIAEQHDRVAMTVRICASPDSPSMTEALPLNDPFYQAFEAGAKRQLTHLGSFLITLSS